MNIGQLYNRYILLSSVSSVSLYTLLINANVDNPIVFINGLEANKFQSKQNPMTKLPVSVAKYGYNAHCFNHDTTLDSEDEVVNNQYLEVEDELGTRIGASSLGNNEGKFTRGIGVLDISYFITDDNDLYLCGNNYSGQQGNGKQGDGADVTTFTKRASNVKKFATDRHVSAYIDFNNDLYMCGANHSGEQGNGTTTNVTTFTKRASNVKEIYMQDNWWSVYFFTYDNCLYMSGSNANGRVGGSKNESQITYFKKIPNVAKYYLRHNCLAYIDFNNDLYMCGENDCGQQSYGYMVAGNIVYGLRHVASNVKEFVGYYDSSAYIDNNDNLYMCGANARGQQGNGTTSNVMSFTKRASNVKTVKLSQFNAGYLTNNGDLYGCGYNPSHQFPTSSENVTTFMKLASNVKDFEMLYDEIFYITNDNKIYASGVTNFGTFTSFTRILSNVSDIKAYEFNRYIITKNGDLYTNSSSITARNVKRYDKTWYTGFSGELYLTYDDELFFKGDQTSGAAGLGHFNRVTTFTKIADNVKSFSTGSDYLGLIKRDGSMYISGGNYRGEQGLGSLEPNKSPVFTKLYEPHIPRVITNYDISPRGSLVRVNGNVIDTNTYNKSLLSCNGYFGDSFHIEIPTTKQNYKDFKGVLLKSGNENIELSDFNYDNIGDTYYVDNKGDLYLCGNNTYGQQGNGTTNDVLYFTKRASNVKKVDVSNYATCYINKNDELYMCGKNDCGQQGNGSHYDVTTFRKVADNVKEAKCFYEIAYYLTNNGELWLSGNFNSVYNYSRFTKIADNIKHLIDVASYCILYINENDELYMCGENDCGQQGTGNYSDVLTLTKIADNVRYACNNGKITYYITKNDDLYMCGGNDSGQQGTGDTTDVLTFTKKASNVRFAGTDTYNVAMYLTNDGDLYMCGGNDDGQQGSGDYKNVLTFTKRASNVKDADICSFQSYYLTNDNDLYMCGCNDDGQQGTGNRDDVLTFTKKASNVREFIHRGFIAAYITLNDDLYMCGYNYAGCQGSGTTDDVMTFAKRGSNVKKFIMNGARSCYITHLGELYKCGANDHGEQGNGKKGNLESDRVLYFTKKFDGYTKNFKKIITTPENIFVLNMQGELYGAGDNTYGQIGNNPSPVGFNLIATDVKDVCAVALNKDEYLHNGVFAYITNSSDLYMCGYKQGDGTSDNLINYIKRATDVREILIRGYMYSFIIIYVTNNGDLYIKDNLKPFVKDGSNVKKFTIDGMGVVSAYITNNDELYMCGSGEKGQQGNGQSGYSNYVDTFTKRASNVKDVFLSEDTSAYITNNDELYMCGSGWDGQQGNGSSGESGKVLYFTKRADNVRNVYMISNVSAYITNSGDLYMTGMNSHGQQGNGTTTNVTTFTKRASNVREFIGSSYSVYITNNDELYMCGFNYGGYLGNGTTEDVTSFTKRASNVSKFYDFNGTVAYITNSGDLYMTGKNNYNQQGNNDKGSTTNILTFTKRASNAKELCIEEGKIPFMTASYTTAYLTKSGAIGICGDNRFNQQGHDFDTVVPYFTTIYL